MPVGFLGLPVVAKAAAERLGLILAGLGPRTPHRKIDNAPGVYMSLSAEWIGTNAFGDLFSIAHYYEQMGDLMRDPDVVLVRCFHDGHYYPVSIRQDGLGIFYEHLLFNNEGLPYRALKAGMRDLASFINAWTRNIFEQQGLKIKKKK